MNYKKTVLVISFLAICGFLFNFGLPAVKAITNAEIQALIAQLQAQIAALQQQLNQQPTDVAWCYTFNNNLRIGDSGDEVKALQLALGKEGDLVYDKNTGVVFDEYCASAVVEFQEKYASEILTPVGLKHGNGFVGKLTRAKLNSLYGCNVTPSCKILWQYDKDQPYCHQDLICGAYLGDTFATKEECERNYQQNKYITITSPNGGEQWKIGENHNIIWKSSNLSGVKGSIVLNKSGEGFKTLAQNYDLSLNKYSWTIDNDIALTGNDFEIAIYVSDLSTLDYAFLDKSDNYFSITTANTACTDSDSGDYYTKGSSTGVFIGMKYYPVTTTVTDFCLGSMSPNTLVEYYCKDNYIYSEHFDCPNGCQSGACKPAVSITVNSNPIADGSGNITIKQGDKIAITGLPLGLSGQMGVDYSRAFFFDSIFDGSCSNDDWVMTCTANQIGTSNFYMEVYKGGQTYRSNVIEVSVVNQIIN